MTRLTILGSGPSSGVPGVGIGWGACDPANPRNRRLRQSVMVERGATRVLVDTSPDLRQQLLTHGVEALDAILFTHAHADHLHGIDDLRGVNRAMNAALPVYTDAATKAHISERFGYVLEPLREGATVYYKPVLDVSVVAPGQAFSVGELEVMPFDQDHGFSRTLGFRFGPIAYSTDVLNLPPEAFEALLGVDVWIIGVFSIKPHNTHAHVDRALEWIDRVRPRHAILTHLGPTIDHAALEAMTPDHVHAAFDGMVIEAREGQIDISPGIGADSGELALESRYPKSA